MPSMRFTLAMAAFMPPRIAEPTRPMLPMMPLTMPSTMLRPMDTTRPGIEASVLTMLLKNCRPALSAPCPI